MNISGTFGELDGIGGAKRPQSPVYSIEEIVCRDIIFWLYLTINSENTIDIKGSSISTGGKISVTGKQIYISNGFSVQKGGKFAITRKR